MEVVSIVIEFFYVLIYIVFIYVILYIDCCLYFVLVSIDNGGVFFFI